jgi:hypothetical protein
MVGRLYRVVAYELWVDPGDRADETVVLTLGPDGETEMVGEEMILRIRTHDQPLREQALGKISGLWADMAEDEVRCRWVHGETC